jgi:hypothetical protein
MSLIGAAVVLFVAVVALLVTVGDALGRVLVAAVGALVRAPWRGGQLIRSRVRDETSA